MSLEFELTRMSQSSTLATVLQELLTRKVEFSKGHKEECIEMRYRKYGQKNEDTLPSLNDCKFQFKMSLL